MDDITLNIDGILVRTPKGMTILKAAQQAGVYIPTLCNHPYLEPVGQCRMCAVQIEGVRGLPSACITPAENGMLVVTESKQLREFRRLAIQPLLEKHPQNCLTCDANNRCELQTLVAYLGLDDLKAAFTPKGEPIKTEDPFFDRDYNLCILCGRCIRVCHEIRANKVIYFYYNKEGELAVGTPLDKKLIDANCRFCGACVDVCPTGALIDRSDKGKGQASRTQTTICPYCGVGCQLLLDIQGNDIIKVNPDPLGPANFGQACVKGRFGIVEFVHHPDRLTKPLIKRDGEFEEVEWNEALDFVAEKLKSYEPEELAVLSSAKCTNEENYVVQKFTRAVLKTNNVDHCARLCHAPTVTGLVKSFGSGAMTNSIAEIGNANCIFAIGTNTTETHPIIGLEVKRAVRNGSKLIVANPKEIDLVKFADVWLQQKPGSDVALLMGMCRVIVEEGLSDDDFTKVRCENMGGFKDSLAAFTKEMVEEATGISWDKIAEAARIYAKNSPASLLFAMGITQHSHGTDNVLATANLAMLTGNVGKESSGVNPLRGQNNVQGACDLGALPNVYPGYQRVNDDSIRKKFEDAWGTSLDPKPGLTVTEIMDAAEKGRIKALYIVGENPMLSDPDINHVREALKKLELLVVNDLFLSETAWLAHVVFPAASFAEKDGTFTNTERRVQRVRKAIEPIGDCKPDWWIICEVAKRMRGKGFEFSHPSEIMDEIASLSPIYGGMIYSRLGNEGLQWPCPAKDHPGTKFLHGEKFTRGLGCFTPLEYKPPAELPDGEYPLVLTTARSLFHFHTGTMTRKVEGLNLIRPTERVEINPVDAEKLNIAHDETIDIVSRRGRVTGKAFITEIVAPGVVSMSFHFAETPTNTLTNPVLDPVSKIPELKVCAIRIEKKEGSK